jgi:hypothetical protein
VFGSSNAKVHEIGNVEKKVLRVGLVTPILQVDPYDSADYLSVVICGQVFQTPYGYLEARTDLRPLVLEDTLDADPSSRRRSARVRPGLCCSDGSRVRAQYVADSLNRQWGKDHAARVEAEGEQVHFHVEHQFQDLEGSLTASWCAIAKQTPNGLIGTGAYRVEGTPTQAELRLVRNPHYGGQQGAAAIAGFRESGSCSSPVRAHRFSTSTRSSRCWRMRRFAGTSLGVSIAMRLLAFASRIRQASLPAVCFLPGWVSTAIESCPIRPRGSACANEASSDH